MNNVFVFILNCLGIPAIHIFTSKRALSIPLSKFDSNSPLFRERSFEKSGRFYQVFFLIKKWKRKLPDGGWLLGSDFRKDRFYGRQKNYLNRFIQESCRAEWSHWFMILATPLFFIWNPIWASLVIFVYSLLSNFPCILTQRYNRIGLKRVLSRMDHSL